MEHIAFVHGDSVIFDGAEASGASVSETNPMRHVAPVSIFIAVYGHGLEVKSRGYA
jgi:hypothetical protein